MSCKRRRYETSWNMKQDNRPPDEISWQDKDRNSNRHRNIPKDDDISRDRHMTFHDEREKQYTTRPSDDSYNLPDRDRSRSRDWESRRSPFCDDRHRSNEYGRNNSRSSSRPRKDFAAGDRNLKESWSGRADHSGGLRHSRFPPRGDYHRNEHDDGDGRRQPNRTSKIQCKFFSAGKCYRDDCKFSHDVTDSQDYDSIRGHKDRSSWHGQQPHVDLNASDLSEKNKSSWDFDQTKKKSWDDDVSNPNLGNKNNSWNATSKSAKSGNNLDEKTKSWNGTLWDEVNVRDGTSLMDDKMRNWDDPGFNEKGSEKNDDFLLQPHNVVNDNDNILSKEANQQILEKGQVENDKSPKKKQELAQNGEQEQETFNPEKGEKGMIGNDDRHKSNEYGNHGRINSHSRGDNSKEDWSHKPDYSSYSHNRNSRNLYNDDDDRDGRRQSTRISKVQCKFFSAGNCHRDNCKFSHDVSDSHHHDRRSYDNIRAHKNTSHASDLSERNKSWDGPTWNDVSKSNPNSDDKNKSWNAPSWNDVDEKNTKSWARMDNENRKWDEKSQHHLVNDSHLLSEEANQQTLTSGNSVDHVKSLPKEEGKIGNDVMENGKDKSPKKTTVAENAKPEENVNQEKVDEGNIGNDEKLMRPFRTALVEFVKEVLKPKWKEGRMTREVYKTVVKKVVEKVTSSIQGTHIPTTEAKIDQYLTRSKPKIIKLLEAYVEKLVKS